MASVGVAPTGLREAPSGHTVGVDKLPEEMNDMKIRDDKVRCSIVLILLLLLVVVIFVLLYLFGLLIIFPSNIHIPSLCFRKWKPQLLMAMGQRQVI